MSNVTITHWDTSTNKDVFKTLVDEWFNNTDREPLVEWKRLCKDLKTSDEYERRGRWAGLDYAGAVSEGQEIPIQKPVFDTTKDYTQVSYGTGFRITHRMKKFNKIGLAEELTKQLKMIMEESKDVEIAKMFNNPTATTYAAGYDTLALASASHTCLDATPTTYDNLLSAALSTSALESVRNYFNYMYDDMGNIITAVPDTLVVNYSLITTAEELLESTNKAREFSNTKNVFKGYLEPFLYHRYTSTTAWSALAKNHPDYDLFVYTSQAPDIVAKDSPDRTRDTECSSLQYFEYGFGDPRMFYQGNT